MAACSKSVRSVCLAMALLVGVRALPAQQAATVAQSPMPVGGYRIAGTVVNKTDLRPVTRARITIRDAQDPQKFRSMVTAEDGKYESGCLRENTH